MSGIRYAPSALPRKTTRSWTPVHIRLDTPFRENHIRRMSMPAARINDMHLCPMQTPAVVPIPHVGGPIIGPCVPNVLVEGMPAAVVGDMCICVGPPDVIVMGSMTVLIAGRPAARVGDSTAHGGVIMAGAMTVLIGDMGGGSGSPQAATMKAARSEGAAFTQVSCATEAMKGETGHIALPADAGKEKKPSWIEIELLDQRDKPVPHERYRVLAPGKKKIEGFLDDKGLARVSGIDPGNCTITFPDLDAASWKPE